MTAIADIKSVETRKAMYSQELAAYTRRQWDMVRRAMEDGSGSHAANAPPRQQESASATPDTASTSRLRHGIRARDFALATHRHLNGQRNMATGKA
ncbi:hypothetical protein GSI_08253 [Ganoderma sinense ZZ0214-1]|uniref:Uncharacterized protein n=1 Tax=Ganoderma sinense ZZ0214-1 TaxID=1077348 RepID=A0A2G8S763_9APHY|nr:hypothetical protein GSI_08253 [Ganoderma sinense ZZ0214-1]